MGISDPAFPSSVAFDMISGALQNESDKKQAMEKGGAIFGFVLKNSAGQTESWYIDLKNKGEVGKGAAPAGEKSNVTLSLSDDDFGKLVKGTTKAQSLFMVCSPPATTMRASIKRCLGWQVEDSRRSHEGYSSG